MTTLVLKIGGNELDEPAFVGELARVVAAMDPCPVLVHGGGKEVGLVQRALGGEPRFVAGLRVTDAAALQAAEMVLRGAVSTRLVAALIAAGADAVGLSGVDRGLIRVEKLMHPDGDLGRVGRPVAVRVEVLRSLLEQGVVPVIAPISLGPDGPYNVNADEAAGAVATDLGASDAEALIADGTVSGGMIPKVRTALAVLAAGVRSARIVNLAGLGSGGGTVFSSEGRP